MSNARFRKAALALPGVIEGAHHGHADFRVGKRVFATLGYPNEKWGMVKLTPDQQAVLIDAEPEMFRPVPGAWGRSGNTPAGHFKFLRVWSVKFLHPRGRTRDC
ncbi:hypothetical protein ABIF69_007876 [Bradyrhizobium japonicum]